MSKIPHLSGDDLTLKNDPFISNNLIISHVICIISINFTPKMLIGLDNVDDFLDLIVILNRCVFAYVPLEKSLEAI